MNKARGNLFQSVAGLCACLLLGPLTAIAQQEPSAAPPPCASAMQRAFDFWLGDWVVHDADGQVLGHNRVTAAERGCVLIEHWLGAGGSSGRSINYFHPGDDRWHQHWVSPGTIIRIAGARDGDAMRLAGDIFYLATGVAADFRGTWTALPDGRVEQHFEQAAADGTWSTWFRGWYTRLPDEAQPSP